MKEVFLSVFFSVENFIKVIDYYKSESVDIQFVPTRLNNIISKVNAELLKVKFLSHHLLSEKSESIEGIGEDFEIVRLSFFLFPFFFFLLFNFSKIFNFRK